jgi:hypothetical protein
MLEELLQSLAQDDLVLLVVLLNRRIEGLEKQVTELQRRLNAHEMYDHD